MYLENLKESNHLTVFGTVHTDALEEQSKSNFLSIYRVVKKKFYDRVCSLHLIKNRFFFAIFSICLPKHTICFKQTFFFHAAEKALHISKKSQKP